MSFGIPVRNGLGLGLLPSTAVSSLRIGGRPAMFLNFIGTTSLSSMVTFSRGSNATLVDSTGKITYAPANLVLQSQTFDNASWSKLSQGTGVTPVVTENFAVAPDGTMTADRVQLNAGTNGSSDYSFLRQTGAYPVPFIRSIWVKSNTGVAQEIALVATASTSKITVPVEWTRVSQLQSSSGALQFDLSVGGTAATPATADILVWGAQLEPVTYQTTPSTYVATTASAYYGPRFDYDPVTLAAKGLLIEEARTNLLTYSEQFDNAAWTKANIAVTANSTTAPDGTNTADTITSSAAAGYIYPISSIFAAAGGATYTLTIYAKAGTVSTFQLLIAAAATYTGTFNLSTGVATTGTANTTVSMVNAGNGWYRCVITAASVANNAYTEIQIGRIASGLTLNIWGAQLELGAFATSYIPTVASTVTRSADVATMTGTNFSSWYNQSEGTLLCEFDTTTLNASGTTSYTATGISDGTSNNSNFLYTYSNFAGGQVRTGNVVQADINGGGSPANNTAIKSAIAYATNNVAVTANGAVPGTDTSATINTTMSQIGIGSRALGNPLNGHIRQIAYYNTRLPNAVLQGITT